VIACKKVTAHTVRFKANLKARSEISRTQPSGLGLHALTVAAGRCAPLCNLGVHQGARLPAVGLRLLLLGLPKSANPACPKAV